MTEDEAKTKVCCGPVGIIQAAVLGNERFTPADDLVSTFTMCCASACMAWRFARSAATVVSKSNGHSFETMTPESYEALPDDWAVARHPPEGFCGLAGRPD